MNRIVFALVAVLLLLSISSITGLIQVVKAESAPIYINADGSISPSTAPIYTADNITYTLAGNITAFTDGIVIERNNIVLNGEGYTVTGSGNGIGTTLTNRSNVTVRNLTIKNFNDGIRLWQSSGNTLSGNNVTANNDDGILLESSSNNTLSDNNIANSEWSGIFVYNSAGNTLSNNTVTASNGVAGIDLNNSSNNTLSGNNVTANSWYGIELDISSGNTLSGNVMVGNRYNFEVEGFVLSDFLQSVDTSNLVDGKPVYYFVNQSNIVVNPDAYPEVGYLGFVNCANVTVQGMNLTNNGQGLLLAYTNNSEITGNNIANNYYGFYLYRSSNCTLSGNDVTNNSYGIDLEYSSDNTLSGNDVTNNWYGIYLASSSGDTLSGNNVTANSYYGIVLSGSSNNFIFHNNFVNNTNQVSTGYLTNVWDNGSVGNYWSDYLAKYPNATETDGSGVWNTPYVIDASNIDHYPLMVQYVVPEFPSFLVLPLMMMATLPTVIIHKKKGEKTSARACSEIGQKWF